jgi:hypothetical protein
MNAIPAAKLTDAIAVISSRKPFGLRLVLGCRTASNRYFLSGVSSPWPGQ